MVLRRVGVSGRQDNLAAVVFLFFEDFICGSCFSKRHPVTDDDIRLQLSGFDMFQQFGEEALDMRLPHSEGQAFLESITEKEGMDKTCIHSRHADRAARLTAGEYCQ